MNVVFAPDWRKGNPYQSLLANALRGSEIDVAFLSDYRRGFPLSRGLRDFECELLHLHWPEAYFTGLTPLQRITRPLKFIPDLLFATRRRPLVVTAHNLVAHDRHGELFAHLNSRYSYTRAVTVIAHSEAAKVRLVEKLGLISDKCHVIPHGDPAVHLGIPVSARDARNALRLPEGPVCLMFGAVKPYKGIDAVIDFWATRRPPALLAIVGATESQDYERKLAGMAHPVPGVITRFKRLDDRELALWLSAADCAIFNYRDILTSGAACLARSWGLPILLPARLDTLDLGEPTPLVRRFNEMHRDFGLQLEAALAMCPDYRLAAPWRDATSWAKIARATANVYMKATKGFSVGSRIRKINQSA